MKRKRGNETLLSKDEGRWYSTDREREKATEWD